MGLAGSLPVLVAAALALAAPLDPRAGDQPAVPPALAPAQPPPALVDRLNALEAGWGSVVGIAVSDIDAGWTAQAAGLVVEPQQSVSKLWVAMTVFDAVDHGRLHLDDP